jgi:hypothetical protein
MANGKSDPPWLNVLLEILKLVDIFFKRPIILFKKYKIMTFFV